MDHGRLEKIPQTIFRGKGGGSVGLVVGGAELQPAGMEAVVPSSGVGAKGPGTFPEQLLGGGNVASVLSGVELQPDGMEVVVPSFGISAKDLGICPEQLLGGQRSWFGAWWCRVAASWNGGGCIYLQCQC